MKRAIFLSAMLLIASNATAHSGGTDRCGGHYNRKTGDYHVHNLAKYQACYPPKTEQKFEQKDQKLEKNLSDDEIMELIINDSISSYPGNCPCPYNTTKNGSRCGKRSAWSRAGGYSPLCYPKDVPDNMIHKYRKEHGLLE